MATQEKRRLMKRVEKLPEANKTLPAASGASYHFCIDIENLDIESMGIRLIAIKDNLNDDYLNFY